MGPATGFPSGTFTVPRLVSELSSSIDMRAPAIVVTSVISAVALPGGLSTTVVVAVAEVCCGIGSLSATSMYVAVARSETDVVPGGAVPLCTSTGYFTAPAGKSSASPVVVSIATSLTLTTSVTLIVRSRLDGLVAKTVDTQVTSPVTGVRVHSIVLTKLDVGLARQVSTETSAGTLPLLTVQRNPFPRAAWMVLLSCCGCSPPVCRPTFWLEDAKFSDPNRPLSDAPG